MIPQSGNNSQESPSIQEKGKEKQSDNSIVMVMIPLIYD